MSRAGRRLTGLRVHDRPSQAVLGWSSAARLILQPRDPVLRITVQPGAYDVLPTGVDLSNLRDGGSPVRLQDHLGAQGHATDRLPTHPLQLLPLGVAQLHVYHLSCLLPVKAA